MAVDDKLEIFKEDVIRLFNAAKAFEKKFAESSKNLTDQVKTPNKVVAKKKPPTASKKKQKNTVYFLLHRNFHDINLALLLMESINDRSLGIRKFNSFLKSVNHAEFITCFVTWFWGRSYQSQLGYVYLFSLG